jgi:hypothetical protein
MDVRVAGRRREPVPGLVWPRAFAATPKSDAARNVTFTQNAVARLQQINMNLS